MTRSKKIKTALIGCGYWGSILKRYIKANKDLELKYVCDSKFDLKKVWGDEEIEAVVIAVPNNVRYSIVKTALSKGMWVLSEKPLALKSDQCEKLAKLAEVVGGGKCKLLINYTFTFSKALKKAKKIIYDIGELEAVEMSLGHLGRFGGGNVYWILGSNILSVLDMFITIKYLSFTKKDLVKNKRIVETGVIDFNGGQIKVSLNTINKETKIIFYGKNWTMIYDAINQPSLIFQSYKRKHWVIGSKLPKKIKRFRIDESNNLKYTMEHFVKLIRDKEKDNVERAVIITKILEAL